ncbi:MAG: integration host factor subunit beta [Bacteroidetes bacterium]|nr:integration host factor subunit beta [Bacteroidota bacterium]MCH7724001.1 integration host factor subunit beta [Bacteroidota bacterium]MCH7769447.1 integration host factor subunit beta [Bacteroidota bacterium]
MTKADIVDKVAAGTGLTKLETEAIIEGFFKTVIESLKDGKGIEIRGFGSYKVKKKNPRQARNPKTGEQVFVPEHYVPTFKFSREFKDIVNEGMKNNEQEAAS